MFSSQMDGFKTRVNVISMFVFMNLINCWYAVCKSVDVGNDIIYGISTTPCTM